MKLEHVVTGDVQIVTPITGLSRVSPHAASFLRNAEVLDGVAFAFLGDFAMSERDTFGPRLRRQRERLRHHARNHRPRTNVSLELWEGFESNDLSRWPTRLYARAFVRDYARLVGLDPDEVVDDFCRLFPVGDRRAVPVIRAQAELIGHERWRQDDRRMMPDGVDRRANPTPAARAGAADRLRPGDSARSSIPR